MGTSLTVSDELISSVAEKIATARKTHGADTSYVVGLFAGLDWLFESGDADAARHRLRDRVLEIEKGGGGGSVAKTEAPVAASKSGERADSGPVEDTWVKGAVKWFNNDKGYGFISTDSDTDVFVHWRDISSWDRSLGQGDEVEFMVTKTAKGYQAINVMKSDKQPAASDVGQAEKEETQTSSAPAEESQAAIPAESKAEAEVVAETAPEPDSAAHEVSEQEQDSASVDAVPEAGETDEAGSAVSESSADDDEGGATSSEPGEQGEEPSPSTDTVETHEGDRDSSQTV